MSTLDHSRNGEQKQVEQMMHSTTASHFTMKQAPAIIPFTLKSLTKKDYTWRQASVTIPAKPPRPAHILHSDDRYIKDMSSETSRAFHYTPNANLVRPDMSEAEDKLRRTNFKMDRDLNKFNLYKTSNREDYYAKESRTTQAAVQDQMESFIPQGDRDKVVHLMSDYADVYRGHDARNHKPPRAPNMHHGGPSTIKGDCRLREYDTSQKEEFPAKCLPRIPAFPAPTGTNIPEGDKDKEINWTSMQQEAYKDHGIRAGDAVHIVKKLQQTNIKLADGHGTFNTYQTTTKDCFRPVPLTTSRVSAPEHFNATNDFLGGDPAEQHMQDMSTSRFYHHPFAGLKQPKFVSGSNKRTASCIYFGKPLENDNNFQSTMAGDYKPVSAPVILPGVHLMNKSDIPLDYYNKVTPKTLMEIDFQNPQQGKTALNPQALENLKKVSIPAPMGGYRQYTTEHVDQFVTKNTKHYNPDTGRLHRSTVPLGTMNPSPFPIKQTVT